MKIVMYPHGGSGNRGCEAIVRGTLKILLPDEAILFSSSVKQDEEVLLNEICNLEYERNPIKRSSLQYLIAFIKYHLFSEKDAFDIYTFKKIIDSSNKSTVALSIGGDNYCYGEAKYIYLINNEIKKSGAKTVLWGCSVDESQLTPAMINDLKSYDLIVARESITYNAMKKINANTIIYPDPAFQLDTIQLSVPPKFIIGNTIGINVSPMIIENESNQGMTLKNYESLIEFIINETDMNIALIPHVIWDFNDDRKPIEYLYNKFRSSDRVCKIDGCGARELKGYIGRCRFFIGARTHSTIAAYSSCVPTLVVGYSVKAKGIAKDLFGTYDHYVLPVQKLKDKTDLVIAFKWIYSNENYIREHLNKIIPGYKEKLFELREVIQNLWQY